MKCINSKKLEVAIKLAKKYHYHQKRETGDNYINHSLNVMNILKKHDFNEEILISAILHDLCEDTKYINRKILNKFGERVGFIVNTLSKNKKPLERKKNKKNEKFIDYRFLMYINRIHMGILADPFILFIKLADQIDNFSTLEIFSKQKQIRKINEIEKYYYPIYEKAYSVLTPKFKTKYKKLKKELENIILCKKANL